MQNHFGRELLISLTVILGSIVVLGAVIYLLAGDMSEQSEKIVTSRALVAQRAATLEALAGLKNDVSQAESYGKAFDKILVSQDQLLDFPKWLNGLSRARRVLITFSFQGNQIQPQGENPGQISFSLDANGSLEDLIEFLKDVEFQSPRFLTALDSFNLGGSDSNRSLSLKGRVFFR